MASAKDLLSLAENRGVNLTEPRKQVLAAMARLQGPFTATQLLDSVHSIAPGVGRATVFRSLQLFSAVQVVERVRLDDGQDVYVAGHPPTHHHHIICTSCGRIGNLYGSEPGRLAEEIAEEQGYSIEGHVFEVYGICPKCRRNSKQADPPAVEGCPTEGWMV